MGGDGYGGPGIEAYGAERLSGFIPTIGNLGQGRRLRRTLGPDQGGLEARLPAQGGDGEGRRVRAHDHKPRDGVIVPANGALPRPGFLGRRAEPPDAIAQPDAGSALILGGKEIGQRGIVARHLLQEDLDPRAAQELNVRPGAALAIDQGARRAVLKTGLGVGGHIGLDTAP
tara:strand:- start:56603 stop:57118 length:516 start_codon:yes stop_codon:yes gene_type:complete